jgi:lysophospholipase L1-like esterase
MRLRRLVAPVVLLCGSLLVAFGMLETSLRLIYPPPARFFFPQEFYDFDPEIGHVLRPRQAAFTHDRPVRINALGLRAPEMRPEPDAGTVRVLALGDSQTFGNGLALEETWPKQLERALTATGGLRWEVVNAGVPGSDTWQHEILLRRLLPAVAPQAVVLALYVNDVVPRHDPRAVDAVAQTNSWSKRLAYLAKRSALVTWTYQRIVVPWQTGSTAQDASVEQAVLAGRTDERAERGWQQVERSLTAMKAMCDARQVKLVLAILPRRDQVSSAISGRAYNERAQAIAQAHGIDVLDLLPGLAAEYRARGGALFVPWDGHNSAVANGVIAARLADTIAHLAPPLGPRSAR